MSVRQFPDTLRSSGLPWLSCVSHCEGTRSVDEINTVYLLAQVKECRMRAEWAKEPIVRQRWLDLADRYERQMAYLEEPQPASPS